MNISEQIKSKLGISSNELIIVSFLLLGLMLGYVYKWVFTNDITLKNTIYKTIDSLAQVQKPLYTGTDITNKTIINNPNTAFRTFKKKELPSNKINLNTASKLELMKLPGVGEKTAIKIIKYRRYRRFYSIKDIMNIKGIGPKKFEKMRIYITVD